MEHCERRAGHRVPLAPEAVPAGGLLKDVEFRNNSKSTVAFTYTIWSEGLKDKGDEVSTTGITAVSPQSKSSAVTGSGGKKVVRVSIERRK